MLLITHDLAIASIISERLAVMYLGKIVEIDPTEEIMNRPAHPYTIGLLSSIPSIGKTEKKIKILGEITNAINIPSGCRFHPRCPFATDKCKREEPNLIDLGNGHYSACHYSSNFIKK
ncbi:MAG: ABC transporter ATP-binding protein, partial [Thermoproteota archaeon]